MQNNRSYDVSEMYSVLGKGLELGSIGIDNAFLGKPKRDYDMMMLVLLNTGKNDDLSNIKGHGVAYISLAQYISPEKFGIVKLINEFDGVKKYASQSEAFKIKFMTIMNEILKDMVERSKKVEEIDPRLSQEVENYMQLTFKAFKAMQSL